MEARPGGVAVGCTQGEAEWGEALARDWRVDEEEVPAFLHRLNLCQSAACQTADGHTIRMWVEPKERKVRCEEQAGEDE